MTSSQDYSVRQSSKSPRADSKEFFRVYLSKSALENGKFQSGGIYMVRKKGDVKGAVIVWLAAKEIEDKTIIQVSKSLQVLYEINPRDQISLSKINDPVEVSTHVNLREVPQTNSATPSSALNEVNKPHWIFVLEHMLQKAEYICPGVVLESVELIGERKTFRVVEVNSSYDRNLYRLQPKVKISIDEEIVNYSSRPLRISHEGIGGLQKQLDQLNEILADYSPDDQIFIYPPDDEPNRGGVILYGASGTGKSAILHNLARAGWRKVLRIDTSVNRRSAENTNSISRIFDDAHRNQPSLVVIDEIDSLAGKRSSHGDDTVANIAPSLRREFDRLGSARILVVAATTSLQHVDERLRVPGCFDYEIEIPVPSSKARAEILKVLYMQTKNIDNKMLEDVAERTHGFVGADLKSLKKRAAKKAKARLSNHHLIEDMVMGSKGSEMEAGIPIEVIATDFDAALLEVRPTAMREVFLQTPNVKWSDIGGQDEVKKAFAQAIEWPVKYSAEFARLGCKPKRGLLLYGPPGCSKTLSAQAAATESGLNFLAVKGGELLSMYVGESERAVREVFRKARSASPSILFFDEIDVIGGLREGNSQHGGVNVVTTLLNELDGIEPLRDVLVVAATNKPDILDPALIRPGRFGTKLFVGLPDEKARRKIMQLNLSKMDVDVDISLDNLAAQTKGYSGAELVSICEKASFAALEDQIKSTAKQRIGSKHLEAALSDTPRGITRHDIERYLNWEAKGAFKISTKQTMFDYVYRFIRYIKSVHRKRFPRAKPRPKLDF